MSPEIISQEGHDTLVDWWSLGIVLYELATGSPPFHSADVEKIAHDIRSEDLPYKDYFSEIFEDLILKLTHKIPRLRLGRGGAADLKSHPFFKKVDWDKVLTR